MTSHAMIQEDRITTAELAEILGVSRQAIRKRTNAAGWPEPIERVKQGGNVYRVAELPLRKGDLKQVERYLDARRSDEAIKNLTETVCPIGPGQSPAAIGAAVGAQIAHEAAASRERTLKIKEQALAEFAALPRERQLEAEAKLALLQARDAYRRQAKIKGLVEASNKFAALYNAGEIPLPAWVTSYARRSGRLSVSWPSLNRWRKAYDERGLVGLVNGYKSPSKTSVPEDVQIFIQGLYTDHPHIKLKRICDAVDARFAGRDDRPSHHAIRRFAEKWTADNQALLLYLANPDAWKNQQMLALGSASEKIVALNQLWEMDGTPTDLMLKDGRHTIVGCLDVWSRRAKMLVAPTSKAAHVSALIRRCMLDWGVPPAMVKGEEQSPFEGIKTDNGSDYVAAHIDLVLDSLQVNHPICPPFSPEKKPHIERFFRTFSHGIVELMPGYVGHNVAQRKAIEARRTFAKKLMKHGEDPIKVELTSEEFQQLCDRWCNAIYHQDVHAELGMSPADKARSWTGAIRRIDNERGLDMLLMPSAGLSTLQKKGIKLGGGWYVSAEFGMLAVGDKLRVHEDPTDLGTIYVYHPNGHFICVAQDPTRTGIDRAELAARAKAIQKAVVSEGSKQLRKQAKKLGTEKAYEEILQHRESQIANVVELPRRSETYTTEALEQAGLAADARQKQVVDPEQRRAERIALEQSMLDTGKLAALPTDPAGRIRLYRQLNNRLKDGESLSEREANWLEDFRKSPDGRMMAELETDCTVYVKNQ